MNLAESVCYILNRYWAHGQRATNQTAAQPPRVPKELVEKRSRLTDPNMDLSKYESGSFLGRYRFRLRSYGHIGDHERVFGDKVVVDLGSSRGEGLLHLTLDKHVKLAIGVDCDEERCAFARELLRDYKVPNARVLCRDACSIPEIDDGSVDIIVSVATFEHILDMPSVLKEAYRILKPGGILYVQASPVWRNYSGSHLTKWLPFPWTHLIFSPQTVASVLVRLAGVRKSPDELYAHLNRMTLRQYRQAIQNSGFRIVMFENISYHPLKKLLVTIPLLGEFISGRLIIFLQKGNSPKA